MNDTSTKVFIALAKIAEVGFQTCYKNEREPTKTLNELLRKKSGCYYFNWFCLNSKLTKEDLEKLSDKSISVGEYHKDATIITIQANSFKCSFETHCVYGLLEKFARLAREEKIMSNAEIKRMTTFTKTFAAETKQKEVKQEVKQETKKPVIIAVNVPKVEKPKQTNNNPYNSDYVAMLAAQLSKLMNNYSVPF